MEKHLNSHKGLKLNLSHFMNFYTFDTRFLAFLALERKKCCLNRIKAVFKKREII